MRPEHQVLKLTFHHYSGSITTVMVGCIFDHFQAVFYPSRRATLKLSIKRFVRLKMSRASEFRLPAFQTLQTYKVTYRNIWQAWHQILTFTQRYRQISTNLLKLQTSANNRWLIFPVAFRGSVEGNFCWHYNENYHHLLRTYSHHDWQRHTVSIKAFHWIQSR